MDNSIYRFILRYSKRQQLYVLLFTLISFPFLYYSLDLPKTIVNEAIGGAVDFPVDRFGFEFGQIEYLMALSAVFLALVFINGGFKYYINVYKGLLGERMLRRLRFELYTRVLQFRPAQFKRMSQGEIIPMITAEVEPMGGFIGDAFALPVFQGGTLLVYIAFIFIQDPILGGAAVALYPLQAIIIPRLQKRVNQLGKQRVRTVRQMSDRIGESVSGVIEIHAHDTSAWHRADFADRLGDIFDIRFEIYRRKFFIKFLNNFINQLTPFFFYSIGGYLIVVEQTLSFGSLVAVLAAYKDLAGPWKELLDYYQMKEDIRIKYEQVVEQFQPPEMIPIEHLTADPTLQGPLPSPLALSGVTYAEPDSAPVFEGLTVALQTDRHIAIIAGNGQGREELMLLLARILVPTQGQIALGTHDYVQLPESVTGRRIAYVGPHAHIFTATLLANLVYGLRHRPVADASYDEAEAVRRRRRIMEAMSSGNLDYDVNADWIDYSAAGVDGPAALQAWIVEVLRGVDLAEDVYRMGMGGTLGARAAELGPQLLQARAAVARRLNGDRQTEGLVELFDADRFNDSATVAENLLFGTPVGPTFAMEGLAENAYVLKILAETGLDQEFLRIGAKVAETMVELFADLAPGNELFEQFSFISAEELPDYQALVARATKDGAARLDAKARARLMGLPFKLIPTRHRLQLIDDDFKRRVLEGRRRFAAELPPDLAGAVEFFSPDRVNASATVQDNILFGKVRYGRSGTMEQVQALIGEVLEQLGLRTTIIAIGLDHSCGVAGARLSAVQRQKVALGRALIRRPDLLILNEATSTLDGFGQLKVMQTIRSLAKGRGLIWAVHRPSLARDFDEVVVLSGGRVAERGPWDRLGREGSVLRELLDAE